MKKIRFYITSLVFLTLLGAPARRIVAQELATPSQVVQEVKSPDQTSSLSSPDLVKESGKNLLSPTGEKSLKPESVSSVKPGETPVEAAPSESDSQTEPKSEEAGASEAPSPN